jgi:hypothetical protein
VLYQYQLYYIVDKFSGIYILIQIVSASYSHSIVREELTVKRIEERKRDGFKKGMCIFIRDEELMMSSERLTGT